MTDPRTAPRPQQHDDMSASNADRPDVSQRGVDEILERLKLAEARRAGAMARLEGMLSRWPESESVVAAASREGQARTAGPVAATPAATPAAASAAVHVSAPAQTPAAASSASAPVATPLKASTGVAVSAAAQTSTVTRAAASAPVQVPARANAPTVVAASTLTPAGASASAQTPAAAPVRAASSAQVSTPAATASASAPGAATAPVSVPAPPVASAAASPAAPPALVTEGLSFVDGRSSRAVSTERDRPTPVVSIVRPPDSGAPLLAFESETVSRTQTAMFLRAHGIKRRPEGQVGEVVPWSAEASTRRERPDVPPQVEVGVPSSPQGRDAMHTLNGRVDALELALVVAKGELERVTRRHATLQRRSLVSACLVLLCALLVGVLMFQSERRIADVREQTLAAQKQAQDATKQASDLAAALKRVTDANELIPR